MRSVDVFPGYTFDDPADRHHANAITMGKSLVCYAASCVRSPDFLDLNLSHFGVSSPFTSSQSPLHKSVFQIVGLRSEEEMIRVDARGNITGMTGSHAVGNLTTVGDLPRQAVSAQAVTSLEADLAVTVTGADISNPAPVILLDDPSHKTFKRRPLVGAGTPGVGAGPTSSRPAHGRGGSE